MVNRNEDNNVLRVRRPRGNTRGPRPGQGRNQGTGVPDTANRVNQEQNTMFPSFTASENRESVVPSRANEFSREVTYGGGQDEQPRNPLPPADPPIQDPGPQRQGPSQPQTSASSPAPVQQQQDEPPTLQGSLQETQPTVFSVLNEISGQTFDESKAAQVIDPVSFQVNPEFQLPIWDGQQVFFGVDEGGNEGYGTLVEDPDFGGLRFQLAPGEIQNEAAAKQAAVNAARQFFINTDEAVRDQNLNLLSQQVSAFLQEQQQQANRDFQSQQNQLDRQWQERLQILDQQAQDRRIQLQQEFQSRQADIDRALQAAQFERQQALEEADFELAQRRFQQESQLANAQFSLNLLQSISQSPEMLYFLQTSGLAETFQNALPGLDLSSIFPQIQEGEQARSQLADADLPSLAELQAMPADVQQRVLTQLAVQTGVTREILVSEIQRRGQGGGLAGDSSNLQRVPA